MWSRPGRNSVEPLSISSTDIHDTRWFLQIYPRKQLVHSRVDIRGSSSKADVTMLDSSRASAITEKTAEQRMARCDAEANGRAERLALHLLNVLGRVSRLGSRTGHMQQQSLPPQSKRPIRSFQHRPPRRPIPTAELTICVPQPLWTSALL